MKRTVSLLLACLMLLSVLSLSACQNGSGAEHGDISGYASSHSILNREIPTFTAAQNGDFAVLQFSDTHLICGTSKKDTKTLDAVRAQIEDAKPDLVVVSGDMIEGNNSKKSYNKQAALQTVGELFESLSQYWAYVPGNNDGECYGSSEDVAAYLSEYPHCILADAENTTGATHYSIDILSPDGQSVVHSLIFMDSLARDAANRYDFMKADQVEWLQKTLDAKKAADPDMRVSVFFHMNTPNFANAGKNGEPYREGYNPIPTDFYEGIDGNEAVDNVLTASGIVGLVSIGHIHPDTNYCSFYNGIYYHITRATGYAASKTPGCLRLTIHTGATEVRSMYEFTEIAFS